MSKKLFILAFCLLVLVGTLIACGSADTNTGTTSNSSSSSNSAPTQAPAKHFKVGDVVNVGGTWQVTVQSVKTATTADGGVVQPKAGDVYVEIIVSMKNLSNKEQNVSSIAQFNLIGEDGTKYTETINSDVPNPPDGKVEAGMPIKGTFTYEVPTTAKKLTFSFQNDIISSGQTLWDLSI